MKTQITTTGELKLNAAQYQTIDSQSLLDMVNGARKECGESVVRNNVFIERIKDELEGEHYKIFVVQKANNTESEVVEMTIKQALRVAARESKAVRRALVDKLEAMQTPASTYRALSTMEILQIAMESEQGRLAEKQRADKAVRTKSQISRKREAVAMGKLSASSRKVKELSERLGESQKHATVKGVKSETGTEYAWLPLRRWCKANGMESIDVADPLYGSVKSWPREAWLAVHGVDLVKLFGVKK